MYPEGIMDFKQIMNAEITTAEIMIADTYLPLKHVYNNLKHAILVMPFLYNAFFNTNSFIDKLLTEMIF